VEVDLKNRKIEYTRQSESKGEKPKILFKATMNI